MSFPAMHMWVAMHLVRVTRAKGGREDGEYNNRNQ